MKKIFGAAAVLALAFICVGAAHAAETGFDKLKMMAEHGDPTSQYLLAMMYEAGVGMPKNINEAKRWYEKSANGGVSEAKSRLAVFNDESDIVNDILRSSGLDLDLERLALDLERLDKLAAAFRGFEKSRALMEETESMLRSHQLSILHTSLDSAKTKKDNYGIDGAQIAVGLLLSPIFGISHALRCR